MLLILFHSAYVVGTRSRSPDCCNSQPAPLVYLSTVLRICKGVTVPEGSRLRNQVLTRLCPNLIHGMEKKHIRQPVLIWDIVSTDWTYQTTRRMKISLGSSPLQWRRLLALDKSRWADEANGQTKPLERAFLRLNVCVLLR